MYRSILFLAVLSLSAVAPAWGLTHLLVDAEQSARIHLVLAHPQGGFSTFLTDGTIAHFDANAQPAGVDLLPGARNPSSAPVQYPGRWWGSADANGNFRVLIDDLSPSSWPDPDRSMDIGPSCSLDKLAGGRTLTRLSLAHPGGAYRVTPGTDGEGGTWMFFHTGHLVRFAPDCRAEVVAVADLDIIEMEADPTDRAVFYLTTDRQLKRLSIDGMQWTRELSPNGDGGSPMSARLVVSESGQAIVSYQRPGSYASTLAAFDATGTQQWVRLMDEEVLNMAVRGDSTLAITAFSVLMIDQLGELVWEDTGPKQTGPRGISAILPSPDGSSSCVQFNSSWEFGDSSILPVMRFGTASGAAEYWLPDWDLRPVHGLTDGSMLFVRVSAENFWNQDAGQALYIGRLDGSLVAVSLPPDMAADRIVATHSDNHGTVSVVEHDGGWTIFSHDAQLRLQWRLRESDTEPSIHASYQLATGADRVCLLTREPLWGQGASQARLSCHRRQNGQKLFEPLQWHARDAVLRADIDLETEVVFYDELASTKLRRILVDQSGVISEPPSRFEPRANGSERIDDVHFQSDGSLLVRWSSGNLHFLPADPELPIRSHMPSTTMPGNDARSLAYGHDRYLRLAYGHNTDQPDLNSSVVELRMFTAAGEPMLAPGEGPPSHWEFPLPLGGWRQHLVTATKDGWLVAILANEYLYVHTLSKDGVTNRPPSLVRITFESNDVEPRERREALAWDRARLMIAVADAHATRVQWFDPFSETMTAATSMRLLPQYGQLPGLRNNGAVVLAGEALGPNGRRPALWQANAQSRQPLTPPEPASFNGAWHDPAISGQGFFIDSMGALNQLFGAWFTFSQIGDHQPGELRWYTLIGDAPGDGGIAELTIYRNSRGRFDQLPRTTAEAVGHARIWQTGNGLLQASFSFDPDIENGLVLAQELHRVLPVSTAPGVRHWFDPAISGQGLLLAEPLEADGHLFGGWFTYDPAGKADDPLAQHWFVIQGGPERPTSGMREATIYRAMGGRLGMQGTSNVQAVGEVTIQPLACDRVEFSYRFDTTDLAGPFAGLNGKRQLRSITGCP